jgi:hypothetical protein
MSTNAVEKKTYSVFGAGASGLYTLWRLLSGSPKSGTDGAKLPAAGDTLELYDWGRYDFSKEHPGTREPGARVCTWHYQGDPSKSYLELGGMRYSEWDTKAKDANGGKAGGHRVVTTVIEQLGLTKYSVPFNESTNPLFYLRTKNMFLNDFSSSKPAPYHVDRYGAASQPDQGFSIVENLAVTASSGPQTRAEWDAFYQHGRIAADLPESSIFQKGDLLKDIGYWNLMYDQLGGEGYNYSADGNGYTSNVINWNSAVAFEANNEFTPGTQYKTLTTGYSGMFTALFNAIVELAARKGVEFKYYPNTRIHSVVMKDHKVHYTYATREEPWHPAGSRTTDAAWLAMPRHSLELVAQATRYQKTGGLDVLNHQKVRLYLEAAIMQPSYKVGMFFTSPWWVTATYAPQLTGYVVTADVIAQVRQEGFPASYLKALEKIAGKAYASTAGLLTDVQQLIQERLTVKQEDQLTAAATRNTIGPSVTDTPIRQVVYFGNNARDRSGEPIYGILASYDDETFTTFWRELELGPNEQRHIPISEDDQPLKGPRKVPAKMVKMLRKQLAELHFGPGSDYAMVPEPKEAAYIDWSLPPFNAGYHAWAAHYDIADVQQKIRKPSQMIAGGDANIFIVGEAYSNDQAWVEGAYCTAESVLNDFFDLQPIIDNTHYPFICRVVKKGEPLAKAAGAAE